MELYIVALLLCVTIASVIPLTVYRHVREAVVKVIDRCNQQVIV